MLLAGLAAVVAGAAVAYVIAPTFGAPDFDPIWELAAALGGADPFDPVDVGLRGWLIAVGCAEVVALLFALLWDVVPPRNHPVVKALLVGAGLFLALGLPLPAIPTAVAFCLALGLVYRPFPVPLPLRRQPHFE